TAPVSTPLPDVFSNERITILGGQPLKGDVIASGSKNSSLPILAASLLASRGQCVLHNVPNITDVEMMCTMLTSLGATVKRENGTVIIDATHLSTHIAPEEQVSR